MNWKVHNLSIQKDTLIPPENFDKIIEKAQFLYI